MSQKVKRDVQSAYLGHPARESLICSVGRMTLTRDPRAPKELSDAQKSELERDPEFQEILQQKQGLKSDLIFTFGSFPKAQGTELAQKYKKVSKAVKNKRDRLFKSGLDEIRMNFFNTIDTVEIDRQLLGLSVRDGFMMEREDAPNFTLQERARLARNIFAMPDSENLEQLLHRRIQVIKDWTALCNLRTRERISESKNSEEVPDVILTDPLRCAPTQCLFCLGDETLDSRIFFFSRVDNLRRHVENSHLRGQPVVFLSTSRVLRGVKRRYWV